MTPKNSNLSRYVLLLTEQDREDIVARYRDGETLTSSIMKVLPPWAQSSAEDIAIMDDIFSPSCRVSFNAITTNL